MDDLEDMSMRAKSLLKSILEAAPDVLDNVEVLLSVSLPTNPHRNLQAVAKAYWSASQKLATNMTDARVRYANLLNILDQAREARQRAEAKFMDLKKERLTWTEMRALVLYNLSLSKTGLLILFYEVAPIPEMSTTIGNLDKAWKEEISLLLTISTFVLLIVVVGYWFSNQAHQTHGVSRFCSHGS
jgi:hypothetical protein